MTTFLCCGWGYSFASSLIRSLLDRPNLTVSLAAILPLAAVWAALERKRWGRLTLQGLSFLALALFGLILLLLNLSHQVWIDPDERHFLGYIACALRLFAGAPSTALTILGLSGLTILWFLLPAVRAEFERGKRPFLVVGQRLIAVSLIVVWGLTMISTPTVLEAKSPFVPFKTSRRLTLRY